MLFSKNLRKLALGLVVAAAASLGFAAPASADVFYDVATPTQGYVSGSLINNPREWVTQTPITLNLSGSTFPALAGFSQGFLTFTGTPTSPTTVPSFTLTHSFTITSSAATGSVVLLAGTGTSTITRTSSQSVSWVSDPQLFTSSQQASIPGVFSLSFEDAYFSNIPATGNFPWVNFFSVSGSFTTVPEPSTFALLALGGLGLGVRAYRRKAIVA